MIKIRRYNYLRCAFVAFLVFLLVWAFYKHVNSEPPRSLSFPKQDPEFLHTFDASDKLLRNRCVFFIETSAPFQAAVTVGPRQACAIESAARANPHKNIVVLLASWNAFSDAAQIRFRDIHVLSSFSNVHFRWLDLNQFATGTPVEHVIKSNRLHEKPNGAEYLSEILRLVLLYRFGGIYLDLDVVSLKPLNFSNPNFFGAESEKLAGSSVMGLEQYGFGQTISERWLDNFKYFNEHKDVRNGSFLLTYELLQACEKISLQEVIMSDCGGLLKVYPRNVFHPLDQTNVDAMFDSRRLAEAKRLIANASTVHMLHRSSGRLRFGGNAETGYKLVAKTYCPSVYNDNKGVF
ncbi:lactosylceramide 4-alpha-galactosyltransferase-like [Anopheles nili]|uniref:lactosylceramide 4-alpha-galactosyltransferase-like n=1 Tax=Anopheles nili TaxID=185578 RepID=UPI00237BB0B1|nr:lactosylceramide 4-alpha-galactosyltransferase-like [Anopheles nili]